MPKIHPFFAVSFLFGGLLVAFGFYVLVTLGNMEAGMSAGSVPASPSIIPLVICAELYFILGMIASLLPHITVRRALATATHIAQILAVFYLCHIGLPLVNTISGCILIACVVFGSCWWTLTRRIEHAPYQVAGASAYLP
jgi:hypothetical protein